MGTRKTAVHYEATSFLRTHWPCSSRQSQSSFKPTANARANSQENGRSAKRLHELLLRSTTLLRRHSSSSRGTQPSLSLSLIVIMVLIVVVTTPAAQVLARIEVAVLNFLRILTSPAPAISDLPLVLSVNSLSVNPNCSLTDQSRIPHSFTFSLSNFSRLPNRTSQAASKPNVLFIYLFISKRVDVNGVGC